MLNLNIVNLAKKYGDSIIFEDICFHANQGELVTLLGPSGCGKSTLLRCIAGLTEIDHGSIELNGREITQVAPQKRHIAMVFQSYALFPNMTVYENIAFGLKMRKVRLNEIQQRVKQILALVELEKYVNRYPQQLSGGQCQRVALARALVTRPDLLLLDEPLSALDARIRKHLRQQIRQIQQELNLTTIFVTHDQEEALTMSDRVVLMNQGRIEQDSDAETLYLAPKTRFSASFIGNYNILNSLEASRLLGREVRSDIAIRPESILLEADLQHGQGSIIERSLLGNIIRYKVRWGELDLIVDKLNLSRDYFFPLGMRVNIAFEPAHIQELQ